MFERSFKKITFERSFIFNKWTIESKREITKTELMRYEVKISGRHNTIKSMFFSNDVKVKRKRWAFTVIKWNFKIRNIILQKEFEITWRQSGWKWTDVMFYTF